jgi:uncharacterized membrane protein YeaQ/YmgE (transglycosylase-associated protein family)
MGIGAIIGWACFGLIVGAVARFLWPGHQPTGCLATILLGVAGSLVGGMITYALTGGSERQFHPASWVMSIIGAIVVLWIAGATMSRSGPS